MTQSEDKPNRIANASGFLFQLRIEHELQTRVIAPGSRWRIVGREHRWVHKHTGTEGYIDLLLDTGTVVIAIECKRATDGLWVFLAPRGVPPMQRARLLWTFHKEGSKPVADWSDFKVTPPSPEASFCVVRGHGEGDSPMMERIASNLMYATEALAEEELRLHEVSGLPMERIFIPLLVTNADLCVLKYDVTSVDLGTGRIDAAPSDMVPLVRFRKALSSDIPQRDSKHTLEEVSRDNERTILVMNSKTLTAVFKELNLPYTGSWPWSSL